MPIQAIIKDGHLVSPAFAHQVFLDDVINVTSEQEQREQEMREFLERILSPKDVLEYVKCLGFAKAISARDSVLLMFMGFKDQSDSLIPVASAVLGRPVKWVAERISRLRRMRMWVGDRTLGDRFGKWMSDDDDAGLCQLLDVMEIEGEVRSRLVDGDLEFKITKKGCRVA